MKKLLSLMLAAAICLSLCPFAFAEDTVEIEMWSNMYGDELTALIEEYQAAHHNVKVKLPAPRSICSSAVWNSAMPRTSWRCAPTLPIW